MSFEPTPVSLGAKPQPERLAVAAGFEDSWVIPYLNRLSDLVWTMARWQEGEHFELTKARREGN